MLTFLDKIPYGTQRLRRIVFGLTTAFIIYILVGFFVVPPVLKSVILEQCNSILHRHTSLEKVYFNPLTLRVELHKFQIDKLDGEGHFISVREIDASPGLSSIWNLAPVIRYLQLRDFQLEVAMLEDGTYSFDDLIGARQEQEAGTPADDKAETANTPIFPFALYGFELSNATIVFDDRPRDKKHTINELNLIVPFTSSFQDLRKEFTQPIFKAVVNGDPIELKGRTLPFDETLRTEFELGAFDIDLEQYWRYLPLKTPLNLVKGKFSSDISLFFERPQGERMKLFLGGGGHLLDFEMSTPDEGTVFSLKELNFEMEKYSLGDNELIISSVQFIKPYFKLIRNARNTVNWASYFPGSEITNKGAKVKTADDDTALLLDVQHIEVKDGTLDWRDTAVPNGFSRTYQNFYFSSSNLTTRESRTSSFDLSIGKYGKIKSTGSISLKPFNIQADINLTDFQVPVYQPYLRTVLPLTVQYGTLEAHGQLQAQHTADTVDILFQEGAIALSDMGISKPDEQTPSVAFNKFAVSGIDLNLGAQTIAINEVRLTDPSATLIREKTGEIDLAALFAQPTEEQPSKTPQPAAPSWQTQVKSVHITGGKFAFNDQKLLHPATLSIHNAMLAVTDISTQDGAKTPYTFSAQWGKKGLLTLEGTAGLAPVNTSGRLTVKDLPLRPFDPYIGETTDLLFASGTTALALDYQFTNGDNPTFMITGDASLHKMKLKDSQGHGELAGIDQLRFRGIKLENQPYRLHIAEINLARPDVSINFDKNGYGNFQRALRIPPPAPQTTESEEQSTDETSAQETDAQQIPAHPQEKPFFDKLSIGRIVMKQGQMQFRDASVAPPYFTKLTDLTLYLIDVRQSPDARPKFDFKGKIGPTPISVTGSLNPILEPIFSNLTIAVNGMELVPLSPYTVKHLAYPIEKGRLYADVSFHTENWVLNADNKFYVEQLVLGPKDKRPDAPSVPVKFGLALLQDSDGNMTINLPIRGRLDDPNFHIGGIVFKAIASLFVKALASPFSLIGSIFGGGSENMDFVLFTPGRHGLDAAGMQKLETTIKALKERPRLKLEVDGVIDPTSDTQGLIAAIFEMKLKMQKFKSLTRKERSQTTAEAMVIESEEYEELLFEAYADEDDPEGVRPTTLFMVDRQPVDVMQSFIINNITVTEQDLNELAVRRAAAVKDHIIQREPNLTDRVFLLDRRKDKQGKTGVPKHRVDLGIK